MHSGPRHVTPIALSPILATHPRAHQRKGRLGARNVGLGGELFVGCCCVSSVVVGRRLVMPKVFWAAPGAMGGSVP